MNSDIPCKVCGNVQGNRTVIATERLLNMRDEFQYMECANCYCLQIIEIPEDLSKYYPKEYYSFKQPTFNRKLTPLVQLLKKSLIQHYLKKFDPIGFLISIFLPHPFPWLKPGLADFNSEILDIGCGSGRIIQSMQRSGFKNLTGIDPFLEKDILETDNLKILKRNLFEVTGTFDFIMMHHSFEHMDRPDIVLKKIFGLLRNGGHLLIRIPVANSYAWRKYHSYWFALEAPRHLFLHTARSISYLAKEANFTIEKIEFDSSYFHLASSEKYLRDFPYSDDFSMFSKEQMKDYSREAKRLNSIGDGDTACFYLVKK